MIYNNLYTYIENNFLEIGNLLNDYKHIWIRYKFNVNETEFTVSLFHDSSEKTCVVFKPTNLINLDTVTDSNINAHEVFSKLMLAIEHYKNLTGVTEYKYQTNNQQKHNIFQMMATKLKVNAINTEEITE
jgi:hypothetical protein